MPEEESEEVTELKAKIKELEQAVSNAAVDSLTEGYNQALGTMRECANEAMEMTRVRGPAEGLMHLLTLLEKNEVGFYVPPGNGVPHDWLNRWKVELAP